MVFKLKTSKKTMEIFEELGASIHLQPFVLCKLAIALSIREPNLELSFNSDSDGLELNRQTITAEYDDLFKVLIINKEKIAISDEEFFPKYLKAYIDAGAKLLISEYKYSNTNFYQHLVEIDKSL